MSHFLIKTQHRNSPDLHTVKKKQVNSGPVIIEITCSKTISQNVHRSEWLDLLVLIMNANITLWKISSEWEVQNNKKEGTE